ncbi:hypothetical protein GW17_00049392 [Ensete ventricosum]|nr:hypothetical protein GW17_00049392 [Ensete ventricosum]
MNDYGQAARACCPRSDRKGQPQTPAGAAPTRCRPKAAAPAVGAAAHADDVQQPPAQGSGDGADGGKERARAFF